MIDVIKPTLLLNKEKSFNNIKNIQKHVTNVSILKRFKTGTTALPSVCHF